MCVCQFCGIVICPIKVIIWKFKSRSKSMHYFRKTCVLANVLLLWLHQANLCSSFLVTSLKLVDIDVIIELHFPVSSVPSDILSYIRSELQSLHFPLNISPSLEIKEINFTTGNHICLCKSLPYLMLIFTKMV